MTNIPAEREPGVRQLTDAPVRWRKSIRYDNRSAPALYVGKTLDGVAWTCPNCGGINSVVLSSHKRRQFKFECTKRRCGWKERYSFLRAFELLDEISVDRP